MLQELHIRHFAVIDEANIEWHPGLTVITGETGAGKSILMDALNAVLGARGDTTVVPPGQNRSVVTAVFAIANDSSAAHWLHENGFEAADTLIVKRQIGQDGRSRAFLNGEPITLTQLRQLAEQLFDIHSQHAHIALLDSAAQLALLDTYANLQPLVHEFRQQFAQWRQLSQQLANLSDEREFREQRKALLTYQLSELEQLSPQQGEFEQLDSAHRKLTAAEAIQVACGQSALALASDEVNIQDGLSRIRQTLERHQLDDPALTPFIERLIALEEEVHDLAHEINAYAENIEHDPERLAEVEARMATWVALARKHQVHETELPALWYDLQSEHERLTAEESNNEQLAKQVQTLGDKCQSLAAQLSKKRAAAAQQLAMAVNEKLSELGMKHARIEFQITADLQQLTPTGADRVALLFSSHPNTPAQPLAKIASGGELSRLALAIYVSCLGYSPAQTIVFDEIDVGIGGATAEVVGRMLRTLAKDRQVICITHQPQVASLGHHHLLVRKHVETDKVHSQFIYLDAQHRCEELARMLGGINMTETTRQHARELLEKAQAIS